MADGGSLTQGFYSLFRDINKVKGADSEQFQGIVGEDQPQLTLDIDDEKLLKLTLEWEKQWIAYQAKNLGNKWEESEKYWTGKHYINKGAEEDRPIVDNLIFSSLETFLPVAAKTNPEPVVQADNTPKGQALSDKMKKQLVYLADYLQMKLKIKTVTRFWALYYLGVMKMGYNAITNEIDMYPVRTKKLILDPNSTITESGDYTGRYIGEYKRETAENLMTRFPEKAEEIKVEVKEELGTELQYIEWWTPEYVCWTYKKMVLGKGKNPNWNYDSMQETVDEFGNPLQMPVKGQNHFLTPKVPYVFLSVFSLRDKPHDNTSLIEQNLSAQDMVNSLNKQIMRNVRGMNSGAVVSGDVFTKEQASRVGQAMRNGDTIVVPGDVNKAFKRDTPTPIPNQVFDALNDNRATLREIFGTTGLTPQGIQGEDTVRGKIITRESDSSRIGGGITEYIEQFADQVFNWMTQLIYVYYDVEHVSSIIGKAGAVEYITLKNSDIDRRLFISVKEGSLIPQDDLSRRNEAMDLWKNNAIDPITLFDRLQFPNPKETAKQLLIWQMIQAGTLPPQMLFPDFQVPLVGPPGAPPPQGGEGQPVQSDVAQEQTQQAQQVVPQLSQVPIQ